MPLSFLGVLLLISCTPAFYVTDILSMHVYVVSFLGGYLMPRIML
jgi:hypothetical protein